MSPVVQLLPPGGLDQSIVLAVLLGVWVTLIFTETLGWVFVGLVVPGYLASVLVVQPTTAAVIVVEALATYALARGLAYALAPTGVWTPFFGRDRFFLIVLASVLVRQHNQLWVLPWLSLWLEDQLAVSLPPVREFYSIGLVLVPLTANLLWKPGALRGMLQLTAVTGLTYAGLAYVLLPSTNLSLSSFELLYEDTAVDFLGNAKAYILLLTTAALAARFNLRYGWDFGGILIPALLGLLWFSPGELAITLAEALVLWAATAALLRYTPLARLNLEGPRKVALVFTLAVALKWLLSLAVGDRLPGVRARDLFGFGYLLSSLLALRMLHRKSARRVLLPALTTALAGWGLGSLLGFSLELVAPVTTAPQSGPRVASQRLLRTPLGAMALARVQAELAPPDPPPQASQARVAHAEAWAALAAWSRAPGPEAARAAEQAARAADLVIAPLVDEAALRPGDGRVAGERAAGTGAGGQVAGERAAGTGAGGQVAGERAAGGQVARDMSAGTGGERAAGGAAAGTGARGGLARTGAVDVAAGTGSEGQVHEDMAGGTGSEGQVPEDMAVEAGAGRRVVAYAVVGAERAGAVGQGVALLRPGAAGPVISVPRPVAEAPAAEAAALLAAAVDARAVVVAGRDGGDEAMARVLARLAPGEQLELRAAADAPRGAPALHVERALPDGLELRGLGEVRLEWSAPPGLGGPAWGEQARLVLRVHPDDLAARLAADAPALRGAPALLPWLAARERGPAVRPLAPTSPPSVAELVFLERRVAGPVVAGSAEALPLAARMAGLVDHELWTVQTCDAAGAPCRALAEAWRPAATGWATLVVGAGDGPVVEAPHVAEEPGTGRLAAELWAASEGRALVLGGAAGPAGPYAPLQALHQAAVLGGEGPVVQVRGLGPRSELGAEEVVVGLGRPALDPRPLPAALGAMFAPGGALAWVPAWRLADGSAALAPLSGAGNAPLEFAGQLAARPAAVLWFPPALRRAHAPHDPCPELARLRAVGVGGPGCAPVDEAAAIFDAAEPGEHRPVPEARSSLSFAEALARVERFAESGDLHLLRGVIAGGWTLRAGLGRATGRGFVALRGGGAGRALVWLGPAAGGQAATHADPGALRRGLWLRVRSLVIDEGGAP